jgi:hypothetical protein
MGYPIKSFEVCVSGLPEEFVANDIADAVAEFVGGSVLVLSAYPNKVELRLPQHCATHVIKMLVEMHLHETTGERYQVNVRITQETTK